jgi:hypothetical protein
MQRRGIALVFVLTMMSVVVMMTGAFVASNHANFATMGASQRQREALLAAESAIHFCWFQLEHDQNWAATAFTRDADVPLPRSGLEVRQHKNTTKISGKVLDQVGHAHEATFTVNIFNQLGRAAQNNPRVPADSVLLRVVGESGGFKSECDVLYSGEPIYDAALTAQNDITLNGETALANTIAINPSDDGGVKGSKNWIRANGNIKLNKFVGANPGANDTLTVGKARGDQAGVIWAKGDIFAGNDVLRGDLLRDAIEKTGANFAPRSRLNHDVYKLKEEDLKLGDEASKITMSPGSYNLELSTVSWNGGSQEVTTLVHTGVDGKKRIFYDGRRIDDVEAAGLTFEYGEDVTSVRSDANGVVRLDSGDGPSMTFTFGEWVDGTGYTKDHVFKPSEWSTVEVPGHLQITTKIEGQVPQVQLAPSGGDGVLKATGNVEIQGTLRGRGSIVAGGDIWLMAQEGKGSNADGGGAVDVDAQQGDVVLFGKNVNIAAGGNRAISMAGLIYAEEDVNIFGSMKLVTEGTRQFWVGDEAGESSLALNHLELRGSVVAAGGNISVTRTRNMDITYDEKYLRAVTRGLYTNPTNPTARRRIRQAWVRAY